MTLKEKIAEIVPDAKEPYQLHDVLRAIDLVLVSCSFKGYLEYGYFGFYNEEHGWMRWNLALPLDEQSPEVIAFLSSLLLD